MSLSQDLAIFVLLLSIRGVMIQCCSCPKRTVVREVFMVSGMLVNGRPIVNKSIQHVPSARRPWR